MAATRFIINNDGTPFDTSEMQAIAHQLEGFADSERTEYRNRNAAAIAQHVANKILIVSGPGTGKSHLFLDRIFYWLGQDPQDKVLVTSFVRKLVMDLESDIRTTDKLSKDQKNNILVSTLHRFARSIVEKNHGTNEWRFERYFRIIGPSWQNVVWKDVLAFFPNIDSKMYKRKVFEEQMHNDAFNTSREWKSIKAKYFGLCEFYNACGFADLILRATDALKENPQINESEYFIIDEYQDFNHAENELILQLTLISKGLLIVGDDEQVLYENLKSGKATLIRNLYKDKDYVNGMLPFCSRSSFHITKVASYFIDQHRDSASIEKIFLPISNSDSNPRVQVIACPASVTAAEYIQKFVKDNKTEIDNRRNELEEGEATDAFLLILTPAKGPKFYSSKSREIIENIVSEYIPEYRTFSEDYFRLLNYSSLANYPRNNFIFRKVMFYEIISEQRIHELIEIAISGGKRFCELEVKETDEILDKCVTVKSILESQEKTINEKISEISEYVSISDKTRLHEDMDRRSINQEEIKRLEHEEEEEAELEEIGIKKMGAIELITIVGSKGLSADHVIIVGFDDVNMNYVTKNAFYVALARARKSLHIITALKSGGSTQPSDFIEQLPENNVDFSKFTKKTRTVEPLGGITGFRTYLKSLRRFSR